MSKRLRFWRRGLAAILSAVLLCSGGIATSADSLQELREKQEALEAQKT